MPGNDVTVTAVFEAIKYTVAVLGATDLATSGAGSYAMGDLVTIKAGAAPADDQKFRKWTVTGGGVELFSYTEATTTFTMPASNVEVKANFQLFFVDIRDNKTYWAVKIVDQTWMAENLNWVPTGVTGGNWCHGDNTKNCDEYGRLYSFSVAVDACPAGWVLPRHLDWQRLKENVGTTPGTKLKADKTSKPGWDGIDTYGFSALPGGVVSSGTNHVDLGDYGYWWSSTANGNNAYRYAMSPGTGTNSTFGQYSGSTVHENSGASQSNGNSVRCIKDE
jgi:uncharacterized protein (TIGR02145 family)